VLSGLDSRAGFFSSPLTIFQTSSPMKYIFMSTFHTFQFEAPVSLVISFRMYDGGISDQAEVTVVCGCFEEEKAGQERVGVVGRRMWGGGYNKERKKRRKEIPSESGSPTRSRCSQHRCWWAVISDRRWTQRG